MWHLGQISPTVFVLLIVDVRVTITSYLVVVYLTASTFPSLWKGTILLMYLLPPVLSMWLRLLVILWKQNKSIQTKVQDINYSKLLAQFLLTVRGIIISSIIICTIEVYKNYIFNYDWHLLKDHFSLLERETILLYRYWVKLRSS